MTNKEILEQLKDELNSTINKFNIYGNYNLVLAIEKILKLYHELHYIYDYKVYHNDYKYEWYNIEIYIKITKLAEIIQIIPERFTRYKKLNKINDNREKI